MSGKRKKRTSELKEDEKKLHNRTDHRQITKIGDIDSFTLAYEPNPERQVSYALQEVQVLTLRWVCYYNQVRPRSYFGGRAASSQTGASIVA